MIIKNHKNKNQYVLADDIWVRNFTAKASPISINDLDKSDKNLLLANELENKKNNFIDAESQLKKADKVLIVSDGLEFETKHKIIDSLADDVQIVAVNKALAKWNANKKVDLFFINNPYPECEGFLPKNKVFPRCIASSRTNPNFLKKYRGPRYCYTPVKDTNFSGISYEYQVKLDDYRNPVCAAIAFAYTCGANKLFLLCCDDSFKEERPASIKLENNLWSYEQQIKSQKIIDGQLYWLRQNEIKIGYNSFGIKMKHATYIELEGIRNFFEE